MVALPFVVLAAYDSIPSLGEVFNVNTFSILLLYIPVGFSEALSYTPIPVSYTHLATTEQLPGRGLSCQRI